MSSNPVRQRLARAELRSLGKSPNIGPVTNLAIASVAGIINVLGARTPAAACRHCCCYCRC